MLTPSGLKRLQDAIQRSEICDNGGERYTLEQLSDRINVSTKTLSRLWSLNSGVDQKTLRRCFSTFNLDLRLSDYVAVGEVEAFDEDPAPSSSPELPTLSPHLLSEQISDLSTPPQSNDASAGSIGQSEWLSVTYPGGPLAPDSPFYIDRPPIEDLAYREIQQSGCVIRIRAPRGMGKSSLAVRLLDFAENLGYRTVLLDCNEIDGNYLTDLNRLLRCFCQLVSAQLGIPPRLNDYWEEEIGSKLSCTLYFQHYLLQQVETPIVLALNAVDTLFEHRQIAQEFFPMLRSWHEAARRDPNWQKLRQVVIYCTEDYPTLDINCSPFNVGLPLKLTEFAPSQVQDLSDRYGLNWSEPQIDLLMALVGGHPMMLQIAFYYLCCEGMPLDRLLHEATLNGGVFRHYLRQRWNLLHKQPQLLEAFKTVLGSEQGIQLEAAIAEQLEGHGLVCYEDSGSPGSQGGIRVKPRCHLYRIYFRQQMSSPSSL